MGENIPTNEPFQDLLKYSNIHLLFYFNCFKAMDISLAPKFVDLRAYLPILDQIGRIHTENIIWAPTSKGQETVNLTTIDYYFQPRVTKMGVCREPALLANESECNEVILGREICPVNDCPHKIETSSGYKCNSAINPRPIILLREDIGNRKKLWFTNEYLDVLSIIFQEKVSLNVWEKYMFKFEPSILNELQNPGDALRKYFNFTDNEIEVLFYLDERVAGEVHTEQLLEETENEHIRMISLTHNFTEAFCCYSYVGLQERSRVDEISENASIELPPWFLNMAKSQNRDGQIKQIDNIWFKLDKSQSLMIPILAIEHERSNNLDSVFRRFRSLNHIISSSPWFNRIKLGYIIVSDNQNQKESYLRRIQGVGEWKDFYLAHEDEFIILTKQDLEGQPSMIFVQFLIRILELFVTTQYE